MIDLAETQSNIAALGLHTGIKASFTDRDFQCPDARRDTRPHLSFLVHTKLTSDNTEANTATRQDERDRRTFSTDGDDAFLSGLTQPPGLTESGLTRIELPLAPEQDDQTAKVRLHGPVTWNSDRQILRFPADLLTRPIQSEGLLIDPVYAQQHELILKEQRKGMQLTAKINRLLSSRPSSLPCIEEMSHRCSASANAPYTNS